MDEIWTKNSQLIAEKSCQILSHSLALLYAFTVGLKERMPRIIGKQMD